MNSFRLAPAFAVLSAALILVTPAAPTHAADDNVSETRTVTGFDRIRLEGAFETEITAGARGTHFTVSGNRNVVGRVTTEVSDNTLVVKMQPGLGFFERAPRLRITLPTLRGFANDGAGSVHISGLGGGDIEIENAGAASIVASGVAARETITLDGVGKIDASALDAHDVTAENNGVGVVRVRASGLLTMNVNGVGSIRYAGNPAHIDSHINGVGSIGRL